MSETDWEAAFEELHGWYQNNIPHAYCKDEVEQNIKNLIARHTRRTKKDLPVKGLFWVRQTTSLDWKVAQFSQQEVIGVVKFEDFGPHRFDNQWWREHALELEIGPEIVYPGEK